MSSEALKVAAQGNDIDGLYQVIQQDPRVLESIDSIPFVQTPLHVAASLGHFEFSTEIMTLKPSLALKLNPEGFTPIHLALQCDHDEMVLRLVEMNKDLVRVNGREGFTPLHLATQQSKTVLLDKFLKACPDSIEDVTARSETALHIAVKHGNYGALKVLFRWLMRNSRKDADEFIRTILDWKDQKGNTVLHVAALYNHIEAALLLKKHNMVDLDAKNLEGKTASGIASSDHMKSILIKDPWFIESLVPIIHKIFFSLFRLNLTEEERNAYLVVATLIATATYQASLSPPGGLYPSDVGTNNNTLTQMVASPGSINYKSSTPKDGNSIMSEIEFGFFSLVNMISFMASTIAIFILLPRTKAIFFLLYSPTLFLQLSYVIAMMVISPTPLNLLLVTSIYCFSMFLFSLSFPLGYFKFRLAK